MLARLSPRQRAQGPAAARDFCRRRMITVTVCRKADLQNLAQQCMQGHLLNMERVDTCDETGKISPDYTCSCLSRKYSQTLTDSMKMRAAFTRAGTAARQVLHRSGWCWFAARPVQPTAFPKAIPPTIQSAAPPRPYFPFKCSATIHADALRGHG